MLIYFYLQLYFNKLIQTKYYLFISITVIKLKTKKTNFHSDNFILINYFQFYIIKSNLSVELVLFIKLVAFM